MCLTISARSAGHLEKWFNISTDDWQQIRLNIDSKCRSAYRRKVLGLPLSVKQFRFQVPHAGAISAQSHESVSQFSLVLLRFIQLLTVKESTEIIRTSVGSEM